jgi:plasmid stabilization system protein ParE
MKKYKLEFTYSSRDDMHSMKKYILENFKYRELGENFTRKMKEASNLLKNHPESYDTIGFKYRGYDIHLKPFRTYLFFYVVDDKSHKVTVLRVLQDGMDWKFIIKRWLDDNK